LNAATGEVYIEDTKETVLGSAGHAMELKVKNAPNTINLKAVLIEEDPNCYDHLKKVIGRRWPSISTREAEGRIESNSSNVYLLNTTLDSALKAIEKIPLGNALFYFDPLRSVEYSTMENVANNRMNTVFKTGTEFFIFVFTSDWFLGRDDFAPLPSSLGKNTWTKSEKRTVSEADSLFGNKKWRRYILNNSSIETKEIILIRLYKNRLLKWFRYVLPLPFNPKTDQIFHLILCSNFEVGVRMTRNAYASKTGNPRYSPDNKEAYDRFVRAHPETLRSLKTGRKRPLQWLVLWRIITQHEGGVCDYKCQDLESIEPDPVERRNVLGWLLSKGYLRQVNIENAWDSSINRYKLNWLFVKSNLGVDPPTPLRPISPTQFKVREL